VELRGGHRLEGIDDRHDPAGPGNGVALQALRVAAAVPVLVVGERELPRELEQRVVVLADDLGADLRMALDALPVGRRELVLLAQDLGGHAELADVVQRRRLRHHVADLLLRPRGLREQLGVVGEAQHAVAGRGGLVQLHRAPEALDQLDARRLELRGALAHHALELLLVPRERDVHAHARLEHRAVDGFHHVIHRAHAEPFDLRLGLVARGEEHDRDAGGERVAFQGLAYLEARHVGHVDVEQDQVGARAGARELDGGAGVRRGEDLVVLAQRLRHQQ
jgi:hypothetical protein